MGGNVGERGGEEQYGKKRWVRREKVEREG